MPMLSSRALSGLKNYKYQSAGYTLLDDIHQPFWNCKPPLLHALYGMKLEIFYVTQRTTSAA